MPNNAILAIVGDVTAEEAFAGVTKVFGDWERREVPRRRFADAARPDAPRRSIVNKPDAVQTEVRVGHLGIRAQPLRLHGAQPRDRASSAARAPTACTRCCGPSAG